jgi:predicted negative regulator of RcsB-dependent stress response
MAHELEDFEKEQQVKEWLRSNIPLILTGVVGGLLLAFGWTKYQEGQQSYLGQAASLYSEIMETEATEARQLAAKTLREEYADTPYAAVAALEVARQSVNRDDDLSAAAEELQWVQKEAREGAVRHLAGIRLARIQLASGDAASAMATLDAMGEAVGFAGLIAHVRGDAELAMGNVDAAIAAYQQALLDENASAGPMRGMIEMKLNDLGAEAS